MKKVFLFLIVIFIFVANASANSRRETAIYDSNNLPEWIIKEWGKAQKELLELDNLKQDPRRFGPEQWKWVQLEKPFVDNFSRADKNFRLQSRTLLGITLIDRDPPEIIICCGNKETVRHEAVHAILWMMGDLERYDMHYPEFKEYIKELRKKRK